MMIGRYFFFAAGLALLAFLDAGAFSAAVVFFAGFAAGFDAAFGLAAMVFSGVAPEYSMMKIAGLLTRPLD